MTNLKTNLSILLGILFILTTSISQARPLGADTEEYTYRLSQSTTAYQFWTTPPSSRVFKTDAVPTTSGAAVKVYAAKNEFEPFQVVLKPTASGSVTVSLGDFGSGITGEIYQVKYVNITKATDALGKTGPYPDPLWPLANGASVSVTANENTAFWFSLYVPKSTAAGNYTANVTIGGVAIPVQLHVFNFAVPDEQHVKSQMGFDHKTVLSKYSVAGTGTEYWTYVNKMKQYFIDHRLTSTSPLWSGGLTSGGGAPYISYDCATKTFTDKDGIWGFEDPAAKNLGGSIFRNGVGFSSFMAASFKNNDASADQRPTPFCGQTLTAADWYTGNNPNSAYNLQWFSYMKAMQDYLSKLGYLNKAYYYFANEPQDQTDYDAVAWYSKQLKTAAPNLKLMVSEEPKPEIYTTGKIDMWLPVLQNYNPTVSNTREKSFGEETWIYFLHSTRPPYFNPITLDHPGIESKFTGWFVWKYRLKGIAYYSLNSWGNNPWTTPLNLNHNGDLFMLYPPSEANQAIAYGSNNHRFVPSIRFELMRDGLEDYEYLYVLNGGQPVVDQANAADTQANKIISSLTSYTRDDTFIYNLRRLIGLKNGGEIATIPDILPPDSGGTPGNYYINFQDPAGEPKANPLVVNGHQYTKIGWNNYDDTLGYGWYSPNDANWKATYLTGVPTTVNELQKSIIYSDWGRLATFEYKVPKGTYTVTLSVGWYNKTYSHQKVDIEGVSFVNDETTTPTQPYLVRTKQVTINDGKLTMAIGIFDEYTMLNYLNIEAVGGTSTATPTATATSPTATKPITTTPIATTTPTATKPITTTPIATTTPTTTKPPATATPTITGTPPTPTRTPILTPRAYLPLILKR